MTNDYLNADEPPLNKLKSATPAAEISDDNSSPDVSRQDKSMKG